MWFFDLFLQGSVLPRHLQERFYIVNLSYKYLGSTKAQAILKGIFFRKSLFCPKGLKIKKIDNKAIVSIKLLKTENKV